MAEPTGIIMMLAGGVCPAGFSVYNTINAGGTALYLRAATTPNVVSAGSNTHNHSGLGAPHAHAASIGSSGSHTDSGGASNASTYSDNCYYPPHSHGGSSGWSGVNSAAAVSTVDHTPSRASFILCRKT